MTTIINIPSAGSAGLPGSAPGAGQSAGPQGLLDFLSFILGNNAAAQQTSAADASANAAPPDLSAKLAALLKNNPGLQNNPIVQALQKLTQTDAGQPAALPGNMSPDDLLKKLSALVQSPAPQTPDIKPSLTSDLTTAAAPAIQTAAAADPLTNVEAALSQASDPAPDTQTAQALNAIEPQAGPQAPLDPNILQQLQDKLDALAGNAGVSDKDALPQAKEDLIRFLKDKGLAAPAIHQYMAALKQTLEQGSAQQDAAAAGSMPALPQTTPAPAQTPQQQNTQAQNDFTQKALVQAPQPKPQTGADAQPQPRQAASTATDTPVHPSLVNMIASSDTGFGSGADSDTGTGKQDQSFAQLLGQSDGSAAGTINASASLSPQNFVNYMSTAGGAQSPTTQMVSVQLQSSAMQRMDMMTLQLEPADLGRLTIKMKFASDGTVKAHLTADKPETLALLQRDSSHLQRALQQAGFDTDDSTISFDLSQQGQQQNLGNAQDNAGQKGAYQNAPNGANDNMTLQANIAVQSYGYISQGGVNIMV